MGEDGIGVEVGIMGGTSTSIITGDIGVMDIGVMGIGIRQSGLKLILIKEVIPYLHQNRFKRPVFLCPVF